MNNKQLITLGIIFVLIVGLFFYQQKVNQQTYGEQEVAFVTTPIGDIDKIVLNKPNKEVQTLIRIGAEWQLKTPLDTKADQSTVHEMLQTISTMKVGHPISSNPSKYDQFRVTDSTGTLVELYKNSEKIDTFYVGKIYEEDFNHTFVKKEVSDDVYLAKKAFEGLFNTPTIALRDKQILNITEDSIQEVVIKKGNKKATLNKTESGWEMTPTKEALDTTVDNTVTSLLSIKAQDFPEIDASSLVNDFDMKIFISRKDPALSATSLFIKDIDGKLHLVVEGETTVYTIPKSVYDSLLGLL